MRSTELRMTDGGVGPPSRGLQHTTIVVQSFGRRVETGECDDENCHV